MKALLSLLLAYLLLGCANSGIVPTGPDSFMIAKSEWGFTSGAVHKARLLQEASDHCRAMGKQLNVTSTSQNDVALGKTPAAEVHFQCITTPDHSQPEPKR